MPKKLFLLINNKNKYIRINIKFVQSFAIKTYNIWSIYIDFNQQNHQIQINLKQYLFIEFMKKDHYIKKFKIT